MADTADQQNSYTVAYFTFTEVKFCVVVAEHHSEHMLCGWHLAVLREIGGNIIYEIQS